MDLRLEEMVSIVRRLRGRVVVSGRGGVDAAIDDVLRHMCS